MDNTSCDLMVDQVGGNWVEGWIVPRSEQFFSKVQSPWISLISITVSYSKLFTLADCIHKMVIAISKRRDLEFWQMTIKMVKYNKEDISTSTIKNHGCISSLQQADILMSA